MTRVLTGIKPTGIVHLGNYVGAIRPALLRAKSASESFFFIADLHALNQVNDRKLFSEWTYSVAASWLSAGLDPNESMFYRQSDVPEVFELATILTALTPKGWMNKSHAYKAAVDKNIEKGIDQDSEINMGLYTYPILMSADILVMDSQIIPVGKDQIQHVEITRDIAERINGIYESDVLVLPEYEVQVSAESIPGIDGRKMSKSYDNVIPLFAGSKEWKKKIYSIVTDSTERNDPKVAEGSPVFEIYRSLASPEQTNLLKSQLEKGELGWGDAKGMLLELMESEFGESTKKYINYMENPDQIDQILQDGANKVRTYAKETLSRVRAAVGID